MSSPDDAGPDNTSTDDARTVEDDAARRRRLRQEVFGDVLPDTTADERDDGSRESDGNSNDAWLHSNVPPHHG